MAQNLVIVESPAKAKTIKKYLGKDFKVLASYGHVRDLVPKEGAVDTSNGFESQWEPIEKNKKHVDAIAKALKKADVLYLATDPDREGEAISWHLYEMLGQKGGLEGKKVERVVFYEVTKRAVQEAAENPRSLADDLVNAYKARRIMDYLVGFNLSPLLWKKIAPNLAAGRVQSPALRMIVEREDEIEAFVAREYWTIEADVLKEKDAFTARLVQFAGDKVEQFSFENERSATDARSRLNDAAAGKLRVASVEKKQRRRNPAPPFITSTLQQEAVRKLGFNTQRTMRVAQKLYEGITLGEQGSIGLITYMRTDSVNLAKDAVSEIRDFIGDRYGAENLPDEARQYKTKSKNAQEAHEGIRPTSVNHTPESVGRFLDADQLKLYTLIWKRTVACQMVPALFDQVSAELEPTVDPKVGRFRATGSTLVKPGFITVYQEDQDDAKDSGEGRRLPELKQGEVLELAKIMADQHFTEPPPRYTEASLVKALEEHGIGRPSTYASIISVLKKKYVEMDGKRFIPKDVARVVIRFLTEHFTQYVDYGFTAQLEDDLDEISRGERDWQTLLLEFWEPFHGLVENKEETVSRDQVNRPRILGTDPETGKDVSVKLGKYGPYVQIGHRDDDEKPKFAGLRPGQKMGLITLEEALILFQLPRKLGETPEGEPVQANIGRFGPYVKFGDKFASIRDADPYTIELDEALVYIAKKKEAEAKALIREWSDEGVILKRGRWGPFVTDGSRNARIPKDVDPEKLTLEDCLRMLEEAPAKGRGAKKKAAKKKASKKKAAKKKVRKKKKKAAKKKAVGKKAASRGKPAEPERPAASESP